MRLVLFCLMIVLLVQIPALAKLSVYPVIIEAEQVQKGDTFTIVCKQEGDTPLEIQLSVAQFDQAQDGSVEFREDDAAAWEAAQTLGLTSDRFTLKPFGQETIEVNLLKADFHNFYGVLFIKPLQAAISTRLAVLFLLSTVEEQEKVEVASFRYIEEKLELTVINEGERHGLWEGELLYYDSQDTLLDRIAVQSGIVLAGRSRNWAIDLPSWVKRVEVAPVMGESIGERK